MPDQELPPGSTLVAYYRDSGGAEQERSVDQQRDAIQAWCQERGLVVVREFSDRAKPGSSVANRDGFRAMIAHLRQLAPEPERGRKAQDAPTGVICWDMKRFSRDDTDSAFFRADLRRRGYVLLFISDRIPAGDMAPVFESMLSWKAKQDLADLSKDIRRGLRDRFLATDNQGRYLNLWPSRGRVGFRSEPYEVGRKRNGQPRIVQRLIPDKGGEWERVQRAFEMRAAGASFKQIHNETRLYESKTGYSLMLRNPLYIGRLEWGSLVIDDWIEPCVSREVFDVVQARRLAFVENRAAPKTGSGRYPLSGWLKCGICGGAGTGSTAIVHQAGHTYRYRRYMCAKVRNRLEHHTAFYPRALDVERAVYNVLIENVLTPDALFELLQDARPGDGDRQRLQDEIDNRARELVRLETRIGHLVDQIESFGADPEVSARLRERRTEREQAAAQIAQARRQLADTQTDPIPAEVVRVFCENTRYILLTGDVQEVREVLRLVLDEVRIWPDGRGMVRFWPCIEEGPKPPGIPVVERPFRWCEERR